MDTRPAMDTPTAPAPTPPPPAHEGEPQVTVADPTADGYYCGARRRDGQIAADRDRGIENPWPWCRNRAGRGTDHVGSGRCSVHTGSTPSGRAAARLRLSELVGPAIATIARIIADPNAPSSVRLRAAQDVLSRAGYPARMDIDVDSARESLVEVLVALQASDDAEN
jgi:hypothetical protein